MDFDKIGEMALGSRLRALSDKVTKDAEQVYNLYNVELKPKWFPVFYFLSNYKKEAPITLIAKEINQSHPSIIKIVREMSKAKLVQEKKDKLDGRKNNISLTKKGLDISVKIENQYLDVESAIKNTLQQTNHNIWLATQEFEYLLNEKSLLTRVIEEKKIRLSSEINIVTYSPEHHSAFKKLNEEWITTYFKLENIDKETLNNPESYILKKGGEILVAIQENEVIGVCALIKMQHKKYNYELAKMAVSSKYQGRGVGYLLGKSIIKKAKSLGASNLYLESNTILKPAISLYEKLGFKKIADHHSPYERCNIQMELKLD